MDPDLPLSVTLEVRDRCLCLHVLRAARTLARLFDEALRPYGLTNGQFSIMMALNRPDPPRLGDLAPFLCMDRTTLTAAFKPLERKGFVISVQDDGDRRARRVALTDAGREVLKAAVPVWRRTHDLIDERLGAVTPDALRAGLRDIA